MVAPQRASPNGGAWYMSGRMTSFTTFAPLLVLASMLPALAASLRGVRNGSGFWLPLGFALGTIVFFSVHQMAGEWRSGLSSALWVAIGSTLFLFALIAILREEARALAILLLPYLSLLAVLAVIARFLEHPDPGVHGHGSWIWAHIALTLATYAALTLAAAAGLAVTLQDRALRKRRPNPLSRKLPALAVSEGLEFRLLAGAFWLLALGLASGMATLHLETGRVLTLDHKTLLTFVSFLLIGAILLAHKVSGARGRMAARLVLLAYVLVTLGYLGVKLVTGLLLA